MAHRGTPGDHKSSHAIPVRLKKAGHGSLQYVPTGFVALETTGTTLRASSVPKMVQTKRFGRSVVQSGK